MASTDHDLILAGGGLAAGLVALAFRRLRPEVDIAIVEQGPAIGGHHVWSFFDSDIDTSCRWLLEPLITYRWPGYDVRFPLVTRSLSTGYNTILSEQLDREVRTNLPAASLYLSQPISAVDATSVSLADGRVLRARAVLDARGPGDLSLLNPGWQKFLGQELLLDRPHGLERPVVMDACVPQIDGYRFIYLLPFAPDRLFVEDTYYSDDPHVDADMLRERIAGYVAEKGWQVGKVLREEAAALPVAMGGDIGRYLASGGDTPKLGLRAGLFHPTTGYSLPDAVRAAIQIASVDRIDSVRMKEISEGLSLSAWRSRRFYRLLDRMLFRAARPEERYRILQRFYGLDEKLIERFYAARSTMWDRLRILSGRPPVPVIRAVKAFRGGGV